MHLKKKAGYFRSIFPDILILSKKDSNISTKRYGDLRLLNHTIIQSWMILAIFTYNKMWHEVTLHFLFLAALCFARGLLARDNFLKNMDEEMIELMINNAGSFIFNL